jgi:hypothetical protein
MLSDCIFGRPTASGSWVPVAASGAALAYRPFDGIDAAVAKFGDVEIELAPDDLLMVASSRAVEARGARLPG